MGNIYRPNTDYTLATQVLGDNGKVAFIPGVQVVDATGAPAGGTTAATAPFSKQVSGSGVGSANPTYRASGTAYAGYATPTDLIIITGSATKTVLVTGFSIQIQSTAAALQTLYYIKRSTANTGGTPSVQAALPLDSTDAAATAVVSVYGSAPTTGTPAGNYAILQVVSAVVTGAPTGVNPLSSSASMVNDLRQGLVLRGVAQSFALNYAGAALTVGFAATWFVEWIEY